MFTASDLKPVAKKIRTLPKPNGHPLLIAISGFGGAGKTTIAAQLAKFIKPVYVVHIDDFIIKENSLKDTRETAFDRDRLERQVLIPGVNGRQASYQKLIWRKNKLTNFHKIPKVDYLIIEGISVYHPDIIKYYDLLIWIDTDLDTSAKRGHHRDQSNENAKMWDFWKENDRKYFEKYHPRDHADIIISNQL